MPSGNPRPPEGGLACGPARTWALTAALAACAAAPSGPAAAQGVKPGLWEMRASIAASDRGFADMRADMEMMGPDERNKLLAQLEQRGIALLPGGGGTRTTRVCVTADMVEGDRFPFNPGPCAIARRQREGQVLRLTLSCESPPITVEYRTEVTSPTAFSSRTTTTRAREGRGETNASDIAGRWVSRDCGGVAPMGAAPPAAAR